MEIRTCQWLPNAGALEVLWWDWPTEVQLFQPHMITLRGDLDPPPGGWKEIHQPSWCLMMVPGVIVPTWEDNFFGLPAHFIHLIDQVVMEYQDPQEAFTIMWDEVLMLAPEINQKLKRLNVPKKFWLPD